MPEEVARDLIGQEGRVLPNFGRHDALMGAFEIAGRVFGKMNPGNHDRYLRSPSVERLSWASKKGGRRGPDYQGYGSSADRELAGPCGHDPQVGNTWTWDYLDALQEQGRLSVQSDWNVAQVMGWGPNPACNHREGTTHFDD